MADFSSDATRRTRRNLLVASVALLLFKGFDSQIGSFQIAGIQFHATHSGVSAVLAFGVAYFLVGLYLYWKTDLTAMEGTILRKLHSECEQSSKRLGSVIHIVTKWEKDYRDRGLDEPRLVELLGTIGSTVAEAATLVDELRVEVRLHDKLIQLRYHAWDFWGPTLLGIVSISSVFGLVPLNEWFQWAGWAGG